jgi:hypothetical protein
MELRTVGNLPKAYKSVPKAHLNDPGATKLENKSTRMAEPPAEV